MARTASYAFPDGFVWGVAAASAQIEGAAAEDGKGDSIWDRFATTPRQDQGRRHPGRRLRPLPPLRIRLRPHAGLGLRHYRLSVAWPRVVPDGTGPSTPRPRLLRPPDRRPPRPRDHPLGHALPLGPAPGPRRPGGWPVRATADAFRAMPRPSSGGWAIASSTGSRSTRSPASSATATATATSPPAAGAAASREPGVSPRPARARPWRGGRPRRMAARARRGPRPQPPSGPADPPDRDRARHPRREEPIRADQPPAHGPRLPRSLSRGVPPRCRRGRPRRPSPATST